MNTSESNSQDDIRLNASKNGCRLWRNNVGVLKDTRGIPVRYGLANESRNMNILTKSSDLIGIMPYVVKPEDVGKTLGIFMAVECKRQGWEFTAKGREPAQANWINIVNDLGGFAQFATSWKDIKIW